MRVSKSIIGIIVLLVILLTACSGPVTNNTEKNVTVLCDVEMFANISSAELVGLLGEPDNVEKTTTNGFAEFPCVYYEYSNAKKLGEVSFILINDSVAKLVAYNDFDYNNGTALLESFNLTMGESGARDITDTYARYRCITDKVDDLWVTNIDKSSDTFGTLQVTYDMFYFEKWYMTMDTAEESDYQWWTKEGVNSILKAPNTAKYPNILEWGFWKNPFYVVVESYVDAQNSFGAQMRSTFSFIYKTGTSELVYAVFDNEVIVDNGFIETDVLVSQLIDEEITERALNASTPIPPETTGSIDTTNKTQEDNNETEGSSATNAEKPQEKPSNNVQAPTQENTQVETNNIDDLTYIINGVCSSYNSQGGTALNGRLYGTVNSSTSITIEHRIGDTIYSDTEYVVYQMEDTISNLFIETLNDEFPESITVSVYSTYNYMDCTKQEAESPFEETTESGGDLDGIVSELTPEEKEALENAANSFGN